MPYREYVNLAMSEGVQGIRPSEGQSSQGVRGAIEAPADSLPSKGPAGSRKPLESVFHLGLEGQSSVAARTRAVTDRGQAIPGDARGRWVWVHFE